MAEMHIEDSAYIMHNAELQTHIPTESIHIKQPETNPLTCEKKIESKGWENTWWKKAIPLILECKDVHEQFKAQMIEIGKTFTHKQLTDTSTQNTAKYILENIIPNHDWISPSEEFICTLLLKIKHIIKNQTYETSQMSKRHIAQRSVQMKRDRIESEDEIVSYSDDAQFEYQPQISDPRPVQTIQIIKNKFVSNRYKKLINYLVYVPEINPSYIANKLDAQAITWEQILEFASSTEEKWEEFCKDIEMDEISYIGKFHLKRIARIVVILNKIKYNDDNVEFITSILKAISTTSITITEMIDASQDNLKWKNVKELLRSGGVKLGYILCLWKFACSLHTNQEYNSSTSTQSYPIIYDLTR
jgi:hypothetical protein